MKPGPAFFPFKGLAERVGIFNIGTKLEMISVLPFIASSASLPDSMLLVEN